MTNQHDVKEEFKKALTKLYSNDYTLIKRNCSERSIVFRLGLYLANSLIDYGLDVDCEYNRNIEDLKALPERDLNYPDLIVHKREECTNNLLIVEVKTDNNMKREHFQNDIDKLKGFTNDARYLYKFGVHVYISADSCSLAWYQKEQIPEHYHYKVDRNTHALSLVPKNDLQNQDKNAFDNWYMDDFDNIGREL